MQRPMRLNGLNCAGNNDGVVIETEIGASHEIDGLRSAFNWAAA
jgi:hypothetical protein